mgnify:CR=1 FL=1
MKTPEVLYVSTKPTAARAKIEPVAKPAMINGNTGGSKIGRLPRVADDHRRPPVTR